MPIFFAGASPLHLTMTWCKKIYQVQGASLQALKQFLIFNFTLNFLIILHATFFVIHYFLFGIPSGDFQHKNCSVDVVLLRPLASD